MVWTRLGAVLIAVLLTLPAGARTLDILQQNGSIFKDASGTGGAIQGGTTHWYQGAQRDGLLSAGGFKLRGREHGTTNAYVDFLAFCVEITTSIKTSSSTPISYETTPNLFDPLRRSLIATLYQEVYDPSGSVTHQGAFQLTLWKLAHGDVSHSNGDGFDIRDSSTLTNGVLSFTEKADGTARTDSFDSSTPGVFDLSQSWLDNLNGSSAGGWTLTGSVSDHVVFLGNRNSQNLVMAAKQYSMSDVPAVPLPPSVMLSGAGIALLMLLRVRRRRGG